MAIVLLQEQWRISVLKIIGCTVLYVANLFACYKSLQSHYAFIDTICIKLVQLFKCYSQAFRYAVSTAICMHNLYL